MKMKEEIAEKKNKEPQDNIAKSKNTQITDQNTNNHKVVEVKYTSNKNVNEEKGPQDSVKK